MLAGVAEGFGLLDPGNADAYEARARASIDRLDEAIARWEELAAPLRGSPIITYHRNWPYLAEWLGLEVIIELEPKPGIPPSPQHVARVLTTATQAEARVLLMMSYYPDRSARLVAEKAGMTLIRVNGGSNFEVNEDWVDFMDGLVNSLAATGAGR